MVWGLTERIVLPAGSDFLEFNPNKVADTPEFREFYQVLSVHRPWAELERYDIAVDVPVAMILPL